MTVMFSWSVENHTPERQVGEGAVHIRRRRELADRGHRTDAGHVLDVCLTDASSRLAWIFRRAVSSYTSTSAELFSTAPMADPSKVADSVLKEQQQEDEERYGSGQQAVAQSSTQQIS